MNKQNLVIYDFNELFSILNEIKDNLNFNLLNVSKKEFSDLKFEELQSFLIITKNKVPNLKNQIILYNYPLKISKIIETINDHNLIFSSFINGHRAIIKKNTKKTIPKLLFELILIFFINIY